MPTVTVAPNATAVGSGPGPGGATGAAAAWTSPTNAFVSDASQATANIAQGASNINRLQNYTWPNLQASVPQGAIINSLTLEWADLTSGTKSAARGFVYGVEVTALLSTTRTVRQTTIGSGWTWDNLNTLGPISIQFFSNGANSASYTMRVDYLSIIVNYTLPTPTVVTGAASSVTTSDAHLAGTVNPNFQAGTVVTFEYGTTVAYGSSAAAADPGGGGAAVGESVDLSGLSPNTTYHYRIKAVGPGGTNTGSDATFTTSSQPRNKLRMLV